MFTKNSIRVIITMEPTFWDNVDAKIRMDTRRIIGIQNQLATKLETRVNAVAFLFEMRSHNTDALFPWIHSSTMNLSSVNSSLSYAATSTFYEYGLCYCRPHLSPVVVSTRTVSLRDTRTSTSTIPFRLVVALTDA